MQCLTTLNAKNGILLAVAFILFAAVTWIGKLAWSHSIAYNAVIEAGGFWSVTPGWPSGAHVVGLEDVSEESVLVRSIAAQRHNRSLEYLDLQGQSITPSVASSIAKLESLSQLDITDCTILPPEAETLIGMDSLQMIFADPVAAQVLRDAAIKLSRRNIHILIGSNP